MNQPFFFQTLLPLHPVAAAANATDESRILSCSVSVWLRPSSSSSKVRVDTRLSCEVTERQKIKSPICIEKSDLAGNVSNVEI